MKPYDHKAIETIWQQSWQAAGIFEPSQNSDAEKAYILDMFPFPSGSGLHVGHILGYTGTDVLARKARMDGKNVLHPMGWDSFGLPAENFAIKTGVHPAISTKKNIEEFTRQLTQAGIGIAWNHELSSSDPEYYRWTQYLFQLLYKKGLAYRKDGMVNWCPSCQTVLANEQVVGGRCERCGAEVVQRQLKQWYFKITDYADRLLDDLNTLDWPEKIKAMQRNWIGKSEGAYIWFQAENSSEKLQIFTTRPDTIFGATYVVLAPEHHLVAQFTTPENRDAVRDYQEHASKKSELERQFLSKEKTGVFTGSYVLHPLTGAKLPVWIADYVIATYGTGAVMAVPAHDERDADFAAVFQLPTLTVVEDGVLINSGDFSGLALAEGTDAILKKLTTLGFAEKTTTYKLRDWLVSRQRFWGAPIPVAYTEDGTEFLIPESELPVELPMNVDFAPTGKSPLADATAWKTYTHPETGEKLTREVDTLDGFVCSSWYFLRFPDPRTSDAMFNADAVKAWLPVDTYIGGAEHAVLHLLYARFITKVLFDEGLLSFNEPFMQLKNQGMILGPDHQKMSKSKGNVINPDDVIATYGADTLRVYELFMAPFEQEKPWDTKNIIGVRRFLEKVWRLQEKVTDTEASKEENQAIHAAIKKVGQDISDCAFNTAIACLMETVNVLTGLESISNKGYRNLLTILAPLAPHITEELWKVMNENSQDVPKFTERYRFIAEELWPQYEEAYLLSDMVTYVVQVNGKVRGKMEVATSEKDEIVLKQLAEKVTTVMPYLAGKTIKKTIVVQGKLVSFVVA